MARELILNLNKKTSSFGISKIDRKKLYGFKKRLYLDEKGKECSRANLEEETGIVFAVSYTHLRAPEPPEQRGSRLML